MSTTPPFSQRGQGGKRPHGWHREKWNSRPRTWSTVDPRQGGKIRNLRFSSVNIDSLNNIDTLTYQRSLLGDLLRDADVICVQETKLTAVDEAPFLKKFRLAGVFSAGPSEARQTTGVGILFTAQIQAQGLEICTDTKKMDSAGRWVSVEVIWNELRYTIVCVYAPAAPQDRVVFLGGLRTALIRAGVGMSNLCVLGDFNAVLDGVLDRENPQTLKAGSGIQSLPTHKHYHFLG